MSANPLNPPGPFHFDTQVTTLDGAGAVTVLQQDAGFWQDLAAGKHGDFAGGRRLVSSFQFDCDWSSWEMHPAGEELVCLLSGEADFVLLLDDKEQVIRLNKAGSYLIVPRGTWHTARVRQTCAMLFITPGEDTAHRPA
jgi:uncharacterized cupin superfamily protein